MEYTVLSSQSLNDLVTKVKEYIEAGWEPQGGIAIWSAYASPVFYQAMIRT